MPFIHHVKFGKEYIEEYEPMTSSFETCKVSELWCRLCLEEYFSDDEFEKLREYLDRIISPDIIWTGVYSDDWAIFVVPSSHKHVLAELVLNI